MKKYLITVSYTCRCVSAFQSLLNTLPYPADALLGYIFDPAKERAFIHLGYDSPSELAFAILDIQADDDSRSPVLELVLQNQQYNGPANPNA